jgi:fumarate hydratase subunit beta
VQGLGPATVGIDAHGRSLYDEQTAAAHDRREQILRGLAQARKAALPPNA